MNLNDLVYFSTRERLAVEAAVCQEAINIAHEMTELAEQWYDERDAIFVGYVGEA